MRSQTVDLRVRKVGPHFSMRSYFLCSKSDGETTNTYSMHTLKQIVRGKVNNKRYKWTIIK